MTDGEPRSESTASKPAKGGSPVGGTARSADLSRLRIERGNQPIGHVRGFPWIRILLIALIGALAFLFRDKITGLWADANAPYFQTARVTRVVPGQAAEGDVSANGYVVANRSASLATVLSGRLVELNFREGDTVEENEIIARIQHDDLEADLQHAKLRSNAASARVTESAADVEAARLLLPRLEAEIQTQGRLAAEAKERADRLQRDVERNRPLIEKKRIGQGEWDRIQAEARAAREALAAIESRKTVTEAARTAWHGAIRKREAAEKVAQADLATAKQAEAQAVILLEKTVIRAPFRGLVIRKDAEMGEVIAPTGAGNSRGSVVTIVDPTSLEVQVELSERRILRVAEGDTAIIFLDADPETGWSGTVRKIWPRADRSKGTIELRVVFGKRPDVLRPDMAARVVFKGQGQPTPDEAKPAYLTIPITAVRKRADKTFVFVVRDDTVRLHAVVLGAEEGSSVVVEEGLSANDVFVRDPTSDLEDGQRIRTGQ